MPMPREGRVAGSGSDNAAFDTPAHLRRRMREVSQHQPQPLPTTTATTTRRAAAEAAALAVCAHDGDAWLSRRVPLPTALHQHDALSASGDGAAVPDENRFACAALRAHAAWLELTGGSQQTPRDDLALVCAALPLEAIVDLPAEGRLSVQLPSGAYVEGDVAACTEAEEDRAEGADRDHSQVQDHIQNQDQDQDQTHNDQGQDQDPPKGLLARLRGVRGADAGGVLFEAGALRHGRPHGADCALTWEGGTYRGACAEGRPHGEGVCELAGGERYAGPWRFGLPHGAGGGATGLCRASYAGEWRDGAMHGDGEMRAELEDGARLRLRCRWLRGRPDGDCDFELRAPGDEAAEWRLVGVREGAAPPPPTRRGADEKRELREAREAAAEAREAAAEARRDCEEAIRVAERDCEEALRAIERSAAAAAHRPCSLCLDSAACRACVPCGHMVVCDACSAQADRQLRACPVCRKACERIMRVY